LSAETKRIRDALELLGVRPLLLGIDDAAFPSHAGDDSGRGTSCSPAARELLELARPVQWLRADSAPSPCSVRFRCP
jgi:hypothetical protein